MSVARTCGGLLRGRKRRVERRLHRVLAEVVRVLRMEDEASVSSNRRVIEEENGYSDFGVLSRHCLRRRI